MTKQVFQASAHSFSILGRKYPTHAVVGERASFYVYTQDGLWSDWINGKPELYDNLKRLHLARKLDGFRDLVEKRLKEFPRKGAA